VGPAGGWPPLVVGSAQIILIRRWVMSKQKCKKIIFVCRIVTVCSALLMLIVATMFFMTLRNDLSWLIGIGGYLFSGLAIILFGGTFIPLFIVIGLRLKIKFLNESD
jgi:hypothetical protein